MSTKAVVAVVVAVAALIPLVAVPSWLRRHRLRHLAVTAIRALDAVGQPHWVDFGTLLGIVREGDILLGDNDVDVCLWDDDAARTDERLRRAAERLRPRGLRLVVRRWGSISRIQLISRISPGVSGSPENATSYPKGPLFSHHH